MKIAQIQKPKLLYVDDIETNLILFEHTFKNDFEIYLADSGKKALEMLRQQSFTILISDQRMPEMSGNELLEIAAVEFPDVLRFLLTAYTDYETLIEAINKGQIYGFFNKPFNAQEVRMVIQRAVEVYHLREQNKHMLEELEVANVELRTIDQSKTRFLCAITEELKSPINKIISTIHMLKDKIDSRDITELLNYLDSSIARLENFTMMANQLAMLREDGENINLTEVSLKEVVEICFIEKSPAFKEKNIKVSFLEKTEQLKVLGDSDLLITCLGIIINCSAKHSGEGGEIEISLSQNDSEIQLTIINDGKVNLLAPSDNSSDSLACGFSASESDSGLEFLLARQIMEAHGGIVKNETLDDNRIASYMIFPLN